MKECSEKLESLPKQDDVAAIAWNDSERRDSWNQHRSDMVQDGKDERRQKTIPILLHQLQQEDRHEIHPELELCLPSPVCKGKEKAHNQIK